MAYGHRVYIARAPFGLAVDIPSGYVAAEPLGLGNERNRKMAWEWDTGIEATGHGCFLPGHVIDNPEAMSRVRKFFNWDGRWPDFEPGELRSKGNGSLRIHYGTLDALQKLRTSMKRPIIVNSYYRDPQYNASVGGAPASYHLNGMAVDTPTYATFAGRFTLWHYASLAGFRGIGIYDRFTHLDTGPHRFWDERQFEPR